VEPFKLRPFQERALASYRRVWNESTSHLGVAATAFGKSIIMGHLASKLCPQGWRVVILAHREALVDQNAKKVLKVDSSLVVYKEIAGERTDSLSEAPDVISASIQTLRGKRAEACVARWRQDGRKIFLITDEAHHSKAQSYLKFYDLLRAERHLGLTATPFRGDGETLSDIYRSVAFNVPRSGMIDEGWLARPRHFLVKTRESLLSVKSRAGDYVEKDLAEALDVRTRNDLVVASANEAAEILRDELGQPVARAVCFSLSVEHTYALAEAFWESGWEAHPITGGTPIADRRAADERLKKAQNKVVLISCGVLTEGWDVEETNVGLFARPTKSPVLADQMLGRVLRYLEGKPDALVIDFEDEDSYDRVSIAQSFQLPPRWNADGRCLREDEKWFAEKVQGVPLRVQSLLWRAKNRSEAEDLLVMPGKQEGRTLGREYLWWDLATEYRLVVQSSSVVVFKNELGEIVAEFRQGTDREVIAKGGDLEGILTEAEMWVDQRDPVMSRFARSRSSSDPATEPQLKALKRLGIAHAPSLSKGEAGELLNEERMKSNKLAEQGRLTFGKHKGRLISELPSHYLEWVLRSPSDWLLQQPDYKAMRTELDKRMY